MTPLGGTYTFGTIFKMTPAGNLTVLWNLDKTNDGGIPFGSLVQGADGNFYGMTVSGGVYNYGTIFKITPGGNFTVIWNFDYTNDGGAPFGSLTKGNDNNFYGMTYYGGTNGYGTIFKITPGGVLTVIKNLDYVNTGGYPYYNSLIQHTDGNFYGTTTYGGTYGFGTIFKCTPSGTLTVLRHINTTDGVSPRGNLARGTDGRLYGFTSAGGTYNGGTIFKISTSGTFNVLRHLNPTTDGGIPLGSLVVQKANPVANAQNVTTTANTPKAITLTGSGGNPLTFTVVSQPLNGSLSGSGASYTYSPNPGFIGNDAFTFRVTWGCQQSSVKTVSINVTGGASSTVRLNTGGPAVATSLGSFSADNYFTGATSISTIDLAIANTTNDALYQNNRRATTNGGSFQYNIPVSNGNYIVKLHFAETFHTAAGKRKFNVTAEGANWLTNYDIYAVAGGIHRAVVATKSINVTGGMLNLNFTSVVDKACVAAIEALPVAGAERLAIESNFIESERELVTSLYPNPVQSQLTVQLGAPVTNLQTAVKDATGAEVLQNTHQLISSYKFQVEAGLLKPGFYLLQLRSNEGYQTIKFLKE